MLGKTQTGVFLIFGFLVNPLRNSTTSDDIDMKLRPVTKLDKRNKATSKKFDDDVMSKILASLSFFGLLANLEQP